MKPGFTLLELLVTLGIMSTLALVAVPQYGLLKSGVAFNNEVAALIDNLRTAQNRALTGQGGLDHGLELEENRYRLFGVNALGSRQYDSWITLPDNFALEQAGPEVIFHRLLSGDTDGLTTTTLTFGSQVRLIVINKTGQVASL